MNTRKTSSENFADAKSDQAARKQVTVLFCDVVDYTSRSTSMDPEDLADDIRAFQTICTRIADKYHGHISNYLGDGILVLFGHPYASEFDAEHAIRAGMEMIEGIEENNLSFEWRNRNSISIRIGIATSLVVVGEKAGKRRDQDELIFGEAPNLAARLQSLAEPNTVVTSLRTRRLVGGAFRFQELGEHSLKGFKQPVPAWKLLHESTFHNRNYTSLKRVTTRFVSREPELAFLSDSYEKSLNGNPGIVHLTGEAGIGKSRLLRVFEKTLDKQHIYRIRVSCSPYYQSTPLRAVVDEIYRWLQINPDDPAEKKQQNIRRALTVLGQENDEALALFCDLIGVDLPHNVQPLDISAEEKHYRNLVFLGRLVFTLSKMQPVFLIVEDLHWSDPTTLELLGYIIRNSKDTRFFAVLTSRPGFEPNWKQSDSLINLNLGGLNHRDSANLINSVFGDTPLPLTIEESLIKKSDGIPLYLEECSWHILNKIDEYQGVENLGNFTVPDSLQDSLNARLDTLGDAKKLAQLAAVFGSYFTYSNIKRIAALNNIDADNNMDVLLQSGMLKIIFSEEEDLYEFRHVMFQDAAYQSLLKKTRQRYHRQIAELFISNDPGIRNNQPELVAYHYSRTAHLEIAVALWISAGKLAIAKSAFNEARDHLQSGLDLIGQLADNQTTREHELNLLSSLAVCMTVGSGYYGERVTQTYQRCIDLATEIGDTEQQWSALYGLWRCLICKAEFSKALKISVKLNALSALLDERTLRMTSLGIQAMTRMISGKFRSAEGYFRNSARYYDHTEDKDIGIKFGQDPYVTIQGLGAINRLIRNKTSRSISEIEQSVRVARSIGHPYTIAETLRVAAMYEQISRDMVALREYAEETIDISQKFGFEGLLAASNIFMAFSNVVIYRDNHAIETIRQNLSSYKENYSLLMYPYFQGLLAESYLYMHRFQDAFTESNHVLLLIEKFGEVWVRAPMLHIKAESAIRGSLAGKPEIKAWYRDAAELAKAQNANLFYERIKLSLMEAIKERKKQFTNQATFNYSSANDSVNDSRLDQPSVSQYIIGI